MITITYQQDHMPDPVVYVVPLDIELASDEAPVIAYLSERYPYLSLNERKSIYVQQNSLDRSNYFIRKTEEVCAALGWAALFPIGIKRDKPKCPSCGSLSYIKFGRDDAGLCKCCCLDCEHWGLLTNEEYYVELF